MFDPVVQPVVVLRDGSGNPVADAQVTASIASGGGTLEGTTTATTDASGTATFADLGISGTGEQTIEFTSGTFSVISSPVDLDPLARGSNHREVGSCHSLGHHSVAHEPAAEWKDLRMGKDGRCRHDGHAADLGSASGSPDGAAEIHVNEMLFCAGHALLPNGNLMVAGGHHMDDAGIKVTYFFSQDGAPTKGPDMANGRWYPDA